MRLRVFANAPANLRELMSRSREAQANWAGDYLIHENERLSYDAFCARISRLAHALQDELGVRPGDRVAIAMRNYPELLTAMMAVASIGGVVVFLNAWWSAEELDYAFGDSEAPIVFADAPRAERIRSFAGTRGIRVIGTRDADDGGPEGFDALLATSRDESWPEVPIAPDADFAVMYSSGTTGRPKGVVMTHRAAISAVWTWVMQGVMAPFMETPAMGLSDEGAAPRRPAILVVTPLFHVTATHPVFLLSLPLGAKLVLMRKWDAEEAVRLIRDEEVTRMLGVPTQSADLREAAARLGESLPTLDYVGSGGAKRPAAQVKELAEAFPQAAVASGWGMTETSGLGIGLAGPDYLARPEAAGRLMPPLQEMKILDRQGREVPTGEVGELTVKSPANMRCYLNKPDATLEVLRDGWLRTGDLARVDAEGWVTIVDRARSIIIRGGENIACLDVEGALHRHPAVAEAGAFPVPHPRLGETVGAGVTLRPGAQADAAELQAFLREHIAHFKIPERIWFLDEPLPRGATDKIDRRALRARCLEDVEATGG
ncbi:MAG: class I adenylate-forming enzyme family protein [Pseudomonadota bacterium]